jgi:hypothetical protein
MGPILYFGGAPFVRDGDDPRGIRQRPTVGWDNGMNLGDTAQIGSATNDGIRIVGISWAHGDWEYDRNLHRIT